MTARPRKEKIMRSRYAVPLAAGLLLANAAFLHVHGSATTSVSVVSSLQPGPSLGVDRIGRHEIGTVEARLSPNSRGAVFRGARDGNAQYILNRRTSPSDVEAHDQWDDIFVFQSGSGYISHGGEWKGYRTANRGERRGGTLTRAHSLAVGPGDIVRIPAGEPHMVVPRGDALLVYVVVKVKREAQSRR
jgi:mannose-6-phosphate isomerase-like protein (cupin superfamily)